MLRHSTVLYRALSTTSRTSPPTSPPPTSPPTFNAFYRRVLRSVKLLAAADPALVGEVESLQGYYMEWAQQHINFDGATSKGDDRLTMTFLINGERKRQWLLQKYQCADTLPPVIDDWQRQYEETMRVGEDGGGEDEEGDVCDDDFFK